MAGTARLMVVTALLLLGSFTPAAAHPAPFSYLDIVFRNGGIEGTLVVHILDIAHYLDITPADRLLDNASLEQQRERIGALLTPRLSLKASRRLTPVWESLELLRDEQAVRLKYRIPGEQPGSLAIDTNLFPYDPLHQTFINIYEDTDL